VPINFLSASVILKGCAGGFGLPAVSKPSNSVRVLSPRPGCKVDVLVVGDEEVDAGLSSKTGSTTMDFELSLLLDDWV
jgi:hypothetical protein